MSRRASTRSARLKRKSGFKQLPWQLVRNRLPPIEILSAEQVEAIHQSSLTILSEQGITIHNNQALDSLKQLGAEIDQSVQNARLDPVWNFSTFRPKAVI